MNALKKLMVYPQVLELRNAAGYMTSETDACTVKAGCVLFLQ